VALAPTSTSNEVTLGEASVKRFSVGASHVVGWIKRLIRRATLWAGLSVCGTGSDPWLERSEPARSQCLKVQETYNYGEPRCGLGYLFVALAPTPGSNGVSLREASVLRSKRLITTI
jgi:hypothetical protein